ncbi:MAG: hypothetical protein V4687_15935 [Bacteroidota bacterium]
MNEYTLQLPIKKKWFDMIASGEKKEEYREIKFHWVTRMYEMVKDFIIPHAMYKASGLREAFHFCLGYKKSRPAAMEFLFAKECIKLKNIKYVVFTNGYGSKAPAIRMECLGVEIGLAKPEWSDNWQGRCFVIKLGERVGY